MYLEIGKKEKDRNNRHNTYVRLRKTTAAAAALKAVNSEYTKGTSSRRRARRNIYTARRESDIYKKKKKFWLVSVLQLEKIKYFHFVCFIKLDNVRFD